MTDSELIAIKNDLESDRAERKASLADRDKICQAICAFANDLPGHRLPGVIFIGVADDGRCAQTRITDELLLNLASYRADGNIAPFPTMTVVKKIIEGCEVAAAIVSPSDSTPIRYKGQVWIRVGPRRAVASAEEERRLAEKRRAKDVPFDIRPVTGARISELDLDYFKKEYLPTALPPEILAQNGRSPEEQLSALRFAAAVDGTLVPTILGLLVLSPNCLDYVPGAYVQFLRIDGKDLSDPIKNQRRIDGRLSEVVRSLDDVLTANIETAVDVAGGLAETKSPDYPIAALRQLVLNAVMHRNYEGTSAPVRIYWFSDRIEIMNPGGPYGQVNTVNFGKPGVTDYRNPNLAEVLRNLGWAQRFGVGIQIARAELRKNGNPELELAVTPEYLSAIVRKKK